MIIFKKWYMDSNEWFDSIPYKKRTLISLIFILFSVIVISFLDDYSWLGLLVYMALLFNWRYWYLAKKVDSKVDRTLYKRSKRQL